MEISIKYAKEIIHEAIGRAALSAYLCADIDEKFAVYPNGSWAVGSSLGHEIDPDEQPLSFISCPGLPNVDESFFLDGEVYDPDTGTYIDEIGRYLTERNLIDETCEFGDVENELVELRGQLLDFFKESRRD